MSLKSNAVPKDTERRESFKVVRTSIMGARQMVQKERLQWGDEKSTQM
jgi:hypothetical protein